MEQEILRYITYLKEKKNASENTVSSYRRDLLQMQAYLQNKGIAKTSDVTADMLGEYTHSLLEGGKASASVARAVASMKAFFAFAAGSAQSPAKGLKSPKIPVREADVLTSGEVKLLLQQPETDSSKGLRDKAMLELLCDTGIQVSEMTALRTRDVYLDEGEGYVVCGAEKKTRKLPLSSSVQAVLKRYLAESREVLVGDTGCEYLFTNRSGEKLSRQGFWKILKTYCGKAGIEKEITPNMLRGACAVQLVESGLEIDEVRRRLGHGDLVTTRAYLEKLGRRKQE